jgi:acyl-CoA reductase-like NAD-dependent aldehyde dehydrogenase
MTADTTIDHGAMPMPEPVRSRPPSSREDIDRAVAELRAAAPGWVAMGLTDRIELLERTAVTTLAAGEGWATSAAEAKGIRRDSPLMGEDWGSGVIATIRNLKLLAATLTDVRDTGRPRPRAIRTLADGQVAVDVFPTAPSDHLLFPGFHAEVRLDRSVDVATAEARMARVHRGDARGPEVALVLGAGNVSSIGPMDALHQLVAEGRTVLLKLHPVNEHLGEHLERALSPLIAAGVLRIVRGGAEDGRYLVEHPGIDALHMTGSDRTYEAIVWGTGEEAVDRRRRDRPRITKPFTAELGNVTPVIVVPGPWSSGDLAFHGTSIASMLVQNGGFNCIAARMIVQHRAWSKRTALLDAVRTSLRRAEERVPYYPGALDRLQRFVDTYPQAERYGHRGDGRAPFTLVPGLDADRDDPLAFRTESFCGVMAEVALEAPRSIPDYLDAAVEFCNERLWGTLSATILVHPRTAADPAVAAALERALDRLRYGSVVVNHWSAVPYAMVSPSWGAWPGATAHDVQSGIGVVHNTYLLEDVEKSVVRGPFRLPTTPAWFHTHRTLDVLLRRLAPFAVDGDLRRVPGLALAALRG